ncbi:hypothetical protein C7Y47_11440 [Lysinibacillus sphaericus]|uniref:Core-binding (CB) domain-containing protein n=1 Tax=Lysinibacillus sphaericus TaxID=1421 RepID=A0A544UK66_LYSSH|nr:Arm DNA-binding domain-containing protein [Lysinibacillus sp. SDF0037]TQR33644.1 hypothetical protein C7Y47_11440 [Lysinibacillus sp. SDF0037]
MASITKRGSTWQYTVSRTFEGKYKPIRKGGFRTKKEASIAAAHIEADLAKGNLPFAKNIAFTEYFKDWFTIYKSDISQITLNSYRAVYTKLLDYFKETPIKLITKRDYQVFLNNLGMQYAFYNSCSSKFLYTINSNTLHIFLPVFYINYSNLQKNHSRRRMTLKSGLVKTLLISCG